MILVLLLAISLGVDNPADLRPRSSMIPPPPPREERPLKVRPDPAALLPREDTAERPRERDEHALVARVEAALARDPALAQQHRGYLRYLNENPPVAQAERAWWALTGIRAFGTPAEALDEALLGEVGTKALLDQFYDEMARDPAFRTRVEALFHVEFTQTARDRRLSGAYDFLRGNPDLATQWLGNPKRDFLLPEALHGMAEQLAGQPALLEAFREVFDDLMQAPTAHTKAFPWWQAAAALDTRSGKAFAALSDQFHAHPHRFWVWHQRNLRLAADAQARDWIHYWHRKVRRVPELRGGYGDYLLILIKKPVLAQTSEQRWAATLGPPGPWPPDVAPPRLLPRAPETHDDNAKSKPYSPRMKRPPRPSRPTPAMPTMPSIPARPTRPERPSAPERPGTGE